MLDERSRTVLSAVNALCGDGMFKILDEQELGNLCPAGDDVARTLSFLEESGLIELRYAEAGTYCVRVLPKGRSYAEQEASERQTLLRARRDTFFYAFLGALTGGLLGGAVLLLLSLLLL